MPWSYRPTLDGVRAVAVYLVLLFHCGLAAAGGGFIGVDVFFVLSGFLITNVLLSDVDESGRIRFGRFYARRVRRLLPAAVVTVAVTAVAFVLVASVVQRLPLVGDAQSALLYVANWRFLHEQNDYFATGVAKSPFLHFWSLSIEEQFYVVFPLLLLVLARARRWRHWAPVAGLAVLFALSLAAQVYWAGADPNHAYYGTDARAYQLLAGALLAVTLRHASDRRLRAGRRLGGLSAVVGLAGVVLLGSGILGMGVSTRGIGAMAASVLLIGGLSVSDRGPVAGALRRPLPVYLGRISYSTYLWHWPVILVLQRVWALSSVEVALASTAVATTLAAASYELFEMPIRRSDLLDRLRWPVVASGLATSCLVAVAFVPPVLQSTRRPVVVTAPAAARPAAAAVPPSSTSGHAVSRRVERARVPAHMDWSALARDYGPERTCDASAPQQCVVVQGHGLHVLLVGDSHGRMIAPALIALAKEHGFTLSLNVLPSCPWQAQVSNLSQSPADQARCTAARDVWYRTVLPKLHPDVVVLAEYARDDPAVYAHALVRTGGSNETLAQVVRNTTFETLARIMRTGARALILRSIITSSFDPLDCLAQVTYVDQCGVRVPKPPVSDGFFTAAARELHGVFTFDINGIVCPTAPVCLPVLDGINVWRNENHYSTRILVHFREQIWAAIQRSGALRGLPGS